ncbi:hypothetical protein DPMN_087770 [Dreissena polymorpha]|uniref:Uncharacterized protein n=1 Tax=Dreissena polymorpha TaxID=45954 RepID=A0A9D4QVW9_DREPO|nr:hypothetical protein DPMN_087770 [Dreissena polymorpha]
MKLHILSGGSSRSRSSFEVKVILQGQSTRVPHTTTDSTDSYVIDSIINTSTSYLQRASGVGALKRR